MLLVNIYQHKLKMANNNNKVFLCWLLESIPQDVLPVTSWLFQMRYLPEIFSFSFFITERWGLFILGEPAQLDLGDMPIFFGKIVVSLYEKAG